MEETRTIAANPDQVVSWMEGKLKRDFPDQVSIARPIARRNIVQAGWERGLFLKTWFGWIFNLTLTALTLGSWLLIYAVWVVLTIGDYYKFVQLTADPADEEGFAMVTVEGNKREWVDLVCRWLSERYGEQEGDDGEEDSRSRRDSHAVDS